MSLGNRARKMEVWGHSKNMIGCLGHSKSDSVMLCLHALAKRMTPVGNGSDFQLSHLSPTGFPFVFKVGDEVTSPVTR